MLFFSGSRPSLTNSHTTPALSPRDSILGCEHTSLMLLPGRRRPGSFPISTLACTGTSKQHFPLGGWWPAGKSSWRAATMFRPEDKLDWRCMVSRGPGWPHTHYIAKNNLELLIPVHSTSQCTPSSDDVFKSCVLFVKHTPTPVACTVRLQIRSQVTVAIDAPELELQVLVYHQGGHWESNLGQLKERSVLLTADSSLQPCV